MSVYVWNPWMLNRRFTYICRHHQNATNFTHRSSHSLCINHWNQFIIWIYHVCISLFDDGIFRKPKWMPSQHWDLFSEWSSSTNIFEIPSFMNFLEGIDWSVFLPLNRFGSVQFGTALNCSIFLIGLQWQWKWRNSNGTMNNKSLKVHYE